MNLVQSEREEMTISGIESRWLLSNILNHLVESLSSQVSFNKEGWRSSSYGFSKNTTLVFLLYTCITPFLTGNDALNLIG